MGQVLTHSSFRHEPIVNADVVFTARRVDLLRRLNISASTLRRWEAERLQPYDPSHPDGQYVVLPSGRKRYSYERVLGRVAVGSRAG
jgi:hypothetical protein